MNKIFVLVVLLLVSVGQARPLEKNDILITGNIFLYNNSSETSPGESGEAKLNIYDLKLGYMYTSAVYLGALYTMRATQAEADSKGTAMGLTVGYYGQNGFFINGSYILSATFGDFKEGMGPQIDLGYVDSISSAFYLGVQLSYRSISYKKSDTAEIDKHTITETLPMAILGFRF